LKLNINGHELELNIFRNGEKVLVVLTGGTWLPHNEGVLRQAAGQILETIMAPLAQSGWTMQLVTRTPAGWHDILIEWTGYVAKNIHSQKLADDHPRVKMITDGMQKRRAFVQMKNWVGKTVATQVG
jgi:hypothetical protein